MEHVETRAGKLAVEITGNGPPLVLLHSIAHDRHDYDAVVPTLSKSFRTIAVDWPGHGDSEMWARPSSATAGRVLDSLEDVVDALALPPAVFMGNSVGGTASLRFAARRPDRVRGLVLVDSGGLSGRSALVRAFCWLQGREVVRRWTGMAFARFYLKTRGPGVVATLARLEAARRRPGFLAMDAAIWRSFADEDVDLAGAASAVQCPTLIVWGKRDPVIRRHVEGKRLRERIAHARYVELDTGHAPFVERPEAFLAAVVPFLAPFCRAASAASVPDPFLRT